MRVWVVTSLSAFASILALNPAAGSEFRIVPLVDPAPPGSVQTVLYRFGESDVVVIGAERDIGNLGKSLWFFRPGLSSPVQVGFTDLEHTKNDGYRETGHFSSFDNGMVFATTRRWNGGSVPLGQSAIYFDPTAATPQRIGFFGPGYVRADGYQFSEINNVNDSGYAVGHSHAFTASGAPGETAWQFRNGLTTKVGLYDAEHTSATNVQSSTAGGIGSDGWSFGTSLRYLGGVEARGSSAWLFDPAASVTHRAGFTDAEHTALDGTQNSQITSVGLGGRAVGTSIRYLGGSVSLGYSAWVADGPTNLTRVGFIDAEHTRSDGFQQSDYFATIDGGASSIGTSLRFSGGTALGQTAWRFDLASKSIERVGFNDAEHTAADGTRSSRFFAGTSVTSGQSFGTSARYVGGSFQVGQTFWVYDSGSRSTIRVGLYGTEHTSSTGQNRTVQNLTNSVGFRVGTADRYNGAASAGTSVWVYNPFSFATTQVGFADQEHTRADGYRSSSATFLSATGEVAGYSNRYNGASTDRGRSAWSYDPVNGTTRIGFYDAVHTDPNGTQYSTIERTAPTGWIAGNSYRYIAGAPGRSAWVFDPSDGATVRCGLVDSTHTRPDGYQYSTPRLLTEDGLCAGFSARYFGGSEAGLSGWFYDPADDQTVPLVFSVRAGDNYAFTEPAFITPDGDVLGQYRLFNGAETVGDRAFIWSKTDGFYDLGSLVLGGLDANGWSYLRVAVEESGPGSILGYGQLAGGTGDSFPYLLTRVPEPAVQLTLTIFMLTVTNKSRHRRAQARKS